MLWKQSWLFQTDMFVNDRVVSVDVLVFDVDLIEKLCLLHQGFLVATHVLGCVLVDHIVVKDAL